MHRPFNPLILERVAFCAVLLACTLSAPSARADDMADLPLEQLMQMKVSTASRYAQTALEAPAAVSVVTAEDIRLFGYRNLGEVLGSMRGLYVSYDRSYHYLGQRGFATPGDYNTRVLLLVNGVRFNDNVYDQATIGTDFPIDLDLVERVEFVPGPGSAVYGANAFFGVVNVITRNGRDLSGPQVSAETGSHGAAKLRFSMGTVDAYGGDWLVALTRAATRGADQYYPAFDSPATHNGVAQRLDFDRSTQLFARWGRDGLGVTLAHGTRDKGVPTAAFSQVFNDARSQLTDTSTRLAAEYATQLSPRLAFSSRVHAGHYQYVGDYVYDYPPLAVNRDISAGHWWGTEWQWVSTALERHKLSWGMDYRRDTSIRQRNLDLDPPTQYLDAQRSGHVLGVYVQDEFALRPDITLHTGLRWGRQSGSAGAWHPRLGLVYWWNPNTAVKVLHGTAFRPANAYERDYRVDLPGGVVDTDTIRPERVRTTELALEHAAGGSTRMLVTVFRSVAKDLITLADVPTQDRLTFHNARGLHVRGVEAEIEQRFGPQARVRAVYGWQRTRNVAVAQADLTNSPEHLVKLQWSDALPGSAGSSWASSRYAVEAIGIGARRTLQNTRLPGHVLANITVSARWAHLDVSLGVYNLFNRRYSDPASFEIREDAIRQDGRTYRVKLTYRF